MRRLHLAACRDLAASCFCVPSDSQRVATSACDPPQVCEAQDDADPTVGCPPLRNALAVALTVPPRDIKLTYVDTSSGQVDFEVIGGHAARQAVAEAVDTGHTSNENCEYRGPGRQRPPVGRSACPPAAGARARARAGAGTFFLTGCLRLQTASWRLWAPSAGWSTRTTPS